MIQELTEEIEKTARAVVDEVHTALPGKIISFDAKSCTATVEPYGKYITSDETELDYPAITEVPVMFPFCQKNNVGIAFPVCKGDSCLIIISEVELDAWRSEAESEGSLRFDLTSAIAIPGLMRGGSELAKDAISEKAVVIGTPGVKLTVSESGIVARGNLTVQGNISYTGSIYKV